MVKSIHFLFQSKSTDTCIKQTESTTLGVVKVLTVLKLKVRMFSFLTNETIHNVIHRYIDLHNGIVEIDLLAKTTVINN